MKLTKADVKEIVGGVLFMALVVVFFWLYLIATPDQYSAECEYLRWQLENAEAAGAAK